MTQPPVEEAYIIFVEDDPNSYLVLEALLKHAGFRHFYHRSNGSKLFPLVELLPQIDLILLDINLPGEDGFSLLAKLREHPKTANAHIAALTANIVHRDRQQPRVLGFDSFISKPIRPDALCDQVRKMLRGETIWW
jgi:CheY-like chemotaxis protein